MKGQKYEKIVRIRQYNNFSVVLASSASESFQLLARVIHRRFLSMSLSTIFYLPLTKVFGYISLSTNIQYPSFAINVQRKEVLFEDLFLINILIRQHVLKRTSRLKDSKNPTRNGKGDIFCMGQFSGQILVPKISDSIYVVPFRDIS